MTSQLPAAIDWLVAQATAIKAEVPTLVVSDGWPTEDANDMIVVGLSPAQTDTPGESEWAALGRRSVDKYWEIPLEVSAFRGGDDQKLARDACFVLYDALLAKLAADYTLGGACHPRPAEISTPTYIPTTEATDAGTGRRAVVQFSIRINYRT